MDGRKRTVQIKFRVTEAERDLILEKMKLVPTRNMAAYLRKIAIDGYIIQIDHADIKAMTAEIQKIGVNVNQISSFSPASHRTCDFHRIRRSINQTVFLVSLVIPL